MTTKSTMMSDHLTKQFEILMRIFAVALKLHDNDADKAVDWMMNPNSMFFDISPFECIWGGRHEGVVMFLEGVSGDTILKETKKSP